MQQPKKYTNALIHETSPYLLQHAHNPVNWYPWGEEAFEKARTEDKPVLISIGYSACHWCHVMEHESFENEEIAAIMNEHFINIKIDLEERPDIDKIYMAYVQLTTGQGGYPMNVFITPDKIPFFGGTYFPPDPRFNMPSFPQVLTGIKEAWETKRDDMMVAAIDMLGEVRRVNVAEFPSEDISQERLDAVFQHFVGTFDNVNGGFGGSPKFPPAMALDFILRYYKRTGNEKALEMVKKSCDKMANGGIYDQLGGGFHRYTVDAIWLTPHFEKMLYDNAQLVKIYLHLYQVTKDAFYKRIAVETLEYVKREMLNEKGGFYSAQDADSEGVEGKFFVWTPEEVSEILNDKQAEQVFNFFYDVSEDGNFEGENILNVKNNLAETSELLKIEHDKLAEILESSKEKLFQTREKRIKPFRDEKVLIAWNGLMLSAFAEASAILGNDEYLEIARNNADFILEYMQADGYLLRSWKDGEAKLNAYLEDYANFADGLIELYQVSGEVKYLKEAKRLTDLMLTEFWDEDAGGFFFTANNHEELLVRSKDFYDNATPSGNSVGADVLLKLSHLLGEEKYRRFATSVLRLVGAQIRKYPQAFGRALQAIEFYFDSVREIVIIGEDRKKLKNVIWNKYLPNKVVVLADDAVENAEFVPLLQERKKIEDKSTAYVCENYTCQKPVTSAEELRDQLS